MLSNFFILNLPNVYPPKSYVKKRPLCAEMPPLVFPLSYIFAPCLSETCISCQEREFM